MRVFMVDATHLETAGDHVRLPRKVLGISQREAAEAIGVCRDAVRHSVTIGESSFVWQVGVAL